MESVEESFHDLYSVEISPNTFCTRPIEVGLSSSQVRYVNFWKPVHRLWSTAVVDVRTMASWKERTRLFCAWYIIIRNKIKFESVRLEGDSIISPRKQKSSLLLQRFELTPEAGRPERFQHRNPWVKIKCGICVWFVFVQISVVLRVYIRDDDGRPLRWCEEDDDSAAEHSDAVSDAAVLLLLRLPSTTSSHQVSKCLSYRTVSRMRTILGLVGKSVVQAYTLYIVSSDLTIGVRLVLSKRLRYAIRMRFLFKRIDDYMHTLISDCVE